MYPSRSQRPGHADEIKIYCRGGAFVTASAVQRGVITAIDWISPPPHPSATFARREDAVAWCRARLADQAVATAR